MITPRPRINLVLYYGVLAPRSQWRQAVVGERGRGTDPLAGGTATEPAEPNDPPARSWAALVRRAAAARRPAGRRV